MGLPPHARPHVQSKYGNCSGGGTSSSGGLFYLNYPGIKINAAAPITLMTGAAHIVSCSRPALILLSADVVFFSSQTSSFRRAPGTVLLLLLPELPERPSDHLLDLPRRELLVLLM